ncbi:MAG: OmpA family protein [Phycisphaerales bacterium]|nr:OmpA family protein [Phycisphaerales bacterium]
MSDQHEKHGEEAAHGGGGHGGGGHGGGGHGGGEHEESGAPEWLISFADNVALLMGFFVILLAMNMTKPKAGGIGGENQNPSNEEQMADMVLSIRAGFNTPVDKDSTDPKEAWLVKRMKQRDERGETKTPGPDGQDKNQQAQRPSPYVNLAGTAFFQEGAASLSSEGIATMRSVAEELRGKRWIIEVRGHVSAAEADHNKEGAMKLAYDRALATARALVIDGMKWEQLRVAACADNERATPIAQDPGQHRNNQRAEVVITQETVADDPYSDRAAPAE